MVVATRTFQNVQANVPLQDLKARTPINQALQYLSGTLQADIDTEIAAQLAAFIAGASNTQVLFKDGSAIGGDSGLVYDKTNNILGLAVDGALDIDGATTSKAAPAAGSIRHFAKTFSRAQPAVVTEDGFEFHLQPMIGREWRKWMVEPVAVAGGSSGGASIGAFTTVGASFTAVALANTNYRTRNPRIIAASSAVAGNSAGFSQAGFWVSRQTGTGLGGFRYESIFALNTNATGYRFFSGVGEVPFPGLANPSTLPNIFAVSFDDSDASNSSFFIVHNDGAGTATRVSTGITRNTTDAYRIILDCPPGGATLYWHFTNMVTGTVASGSVTTNLPADTRELGPRLEITNAAVASAATLEMYVLSCDAPLN